jgi:hypothetical protein
VKHSGDLPGGLTNEAYQVGPEDVGGEHSIRLPAAGDCTVENRERIQDPIGLAGIAGESRQDAGIEESKDN